MTREPITLDGFDVGLKYVEEILSSTNHVTPFVVAFAGISASGKTTFCQKLHEIFPDSVVLSLDDYFRGKIYMAEHGLATFDDPRCVDVLLAAEHVLALSKGHPIQKPRYSFITGEPETVTDLVNSARFIFVEGLYALMNPLSNVANLKIFVDTEVHGALWRRIARDVSRTGQTPQQISAMFLDEVHPANVQFILPTRQLADIIVKNNMLPDELYSRLADHQYQQKMLVSANYSEAERARIIGILASAGFRESAKLSQRDVWLVPPDRRGAPADELMRLRVESSQTSGIGKSFTLTYKSSAEGPVRALLQFPITKEIRDGLFRVGYRYDKYMAKYRVLYRRPDSQDEIALDLILSRTTIGTPLYLEVRSNSLNGLEECVRALCVRGVQQSKFTSRAYREII